ncbi:MAG: serine O-acetyltransferase [Psychroserpens sp.]|jgi:serine O-acetyltransferase
MADKKERFMEIIKADLKSRGQKISVVRFVIDPITRFHWYLRATEHLSGNKALKPIFFFTKYFFLSLSRNLGFSIPINTLGKGIYIPHYGSIVVNSKAYVGEYSILNVGVCIGRHPGDKNLVPTIGKCVFLAPGVKVFGKVNIGDGCLLGANAVVTKDIPAYKLAVGVPAKVIDDVTAETLRVYGLTDISGDVINKNSK